MKVTPTDTLPEVLIIEPVVFGDSRGFFMESWQAVRYSDNGIGGPFVQDNLSRSARGVLRGLHFQHPKAQGKLVQVLEGEVFDVAVDIRVGSPRVGRWAGVRLSGENFRQLYVPPGFAHGFCVLSDSALFTYKCTEFYHPEHEQTVRWNDPQLGVDWPLEGEPRLSAKDEAGHTLEELRTRSGLPHYIDGLGQ